MSKSEAGGQSKTLDELLPEPEVLLMVVPLYERFRVDESCYAKMFRTEFYGGSIDWFCMECNRDSIFEGSHSHPAGEYTSYFLIHNRWFSVELTCQRNREHKLRFIFIIFNDTLIKIGQYHSIADLYSHEIGKYRKILGEVKYREFARAVGLVSHGVGIGAFVYLRRIFEDLIEEAHQKAISASSWDEDLYIRSRMSERISMLVDYLPSFLVENRGLYSIMSTGIHDLTEDECKRYFDTVRVGIEMILDEKMEEERKREKREKARRAINKVLDELG